MSANAGLKIDIPTPDQVVVAKAKNLATVAIGLKYLLAEGLRAGKCHFDGMYSEHVLDLIRDDFLAGGWVIVNNGLSLTIRERKRNPYEPEPIEFQEVPNG